MAAAIAGQDAVVSALLKAGADPTLKDNDGSLARQLAEQNQHPSTAELLKAQPPKPAPTRAAPKAPRAKPAPKPPAD
jgi:ankyrin repeat protein